MQKFLKWAGVFWFLMLVLVIATWFISPLFREKVLLGGLFAPFSPTVVKKVSAEQLRNYPTRMAAIALVIFINLKYRPPVLKETIAKAAKDHGEEPSQDELGKIYFKAKIAREKNIELASEALKSLCIMTGHDFGSYYEKTQYGYSWGSIGEDRWGDILFKLNSWVAITFGGELLERFGAKNIIEEIKKELQSFFFVFGKSQSSQGAGP